MKKCIRVLSLALVLVMLLSITAFAAEPATDTSKNGQYEITGQNGATATFEIVKDETDVEHEKIKVTYTNTAAITETGLYLILMVTGDGTAASITGPNIKYIDQVGGNAEGKIEFWVYPEQLATSTIVITGTGLNGTVIGKDENGNDVKAVGMIAAIVEGLYVLGDVDGNGTFQIADVTLLLKYLVGLAENTDINHAASDVDGTAGIKISDVTKLLKVLVGLENF